MSEVTRKRKTFWPNSARYLFTIAAFATFFILTGLYIVIKYGYYGFGFLLILVGIFSVINCTLHMRLTFSAKEISGPAIDDLWQRVVLLAECEVFEDQNRNILVIRPFEKFREIYVPYWLFQNQTIAEIKKMFGNIQEFNYKDYKEKRNKNWWVSK